MAKYKLHACDCVCWVSAPAAKYQMEAGAVSESEAHQPSHWPPTTPTTNNPDHQQPRPPTTPATNNPDHQQPRPPTTPTTDNPDHIQRSCSSGVWQWGVAVGCGSGVRQWGEAQGCGQFDCLKCQGKPKPASGNTSKSSPPEANNNRTRQDDPHTPPQTRDTNTQHNTDVFNGERRKADTKQRCGEVSCLFWPVLPLTHSKVVVAMPFGGLL